MVDELVFEDESCARDAFSMPTFEAMWNLEILEQDTVTGLMVREYVIKDDDISRCTVKNFEFVTRLRSIPPEDFEGYWLNSHGPLAATIESIRRYVQDHAILVAADSRFSPKFDGLALTWFDDLAAMRVGASTDAYSRTRADEANFIQGVIPFIIATERTTYR